MSSFPACLKHEFKEAAPPFIYFFIAFHLVAVIRALMQQAVARKIRPIPG